MNVNKTDFPGLMKTKFNPQRPQALTKKYFTIICTNIMTLQHNTVKTPSHLRGGGRFQFKNFFNTCVAMLLSQKHPKRIQF